MNLPMLRPQRDRCLTRIERGELDVKTTEPRFVCSACSVVMDVCRREPECWESNVTRQLPLPH